jgi:phosphate transport system permease protein
MAEAPPAPRRRKSSRRRGGSLDAEQARSGRPGAALPHRTSAVGDLVFRAGTAFFASLVLVLVLAIGFELVRSSLPSIHKFGWRFLYTSTWDPVQDVYGALPFLYGTVVSAALALFLAVPMALGIASFLSELAPARLSRPLGFLVELLAAIPSVIYGLWGIFVMTPWLREGPQQWLSRHFGTFPLFEGPPYGVGMMAAGLILAVMILPTICAICLEVFRAVPQAQREAALALGATRWETTRLAVFSNARSGILGAIILGLGRAVGETMAVTMLIGNRPQISASLFAPGHTMASVIANEFSEANGDLYVSSLIEIALVLFGLTILMNIGARWLVRRATSRAREAARA